jgi:hypothetical protein
MHQETNFEIFYIFLIENHLGFLMIHCKVTENNANYRRQKDI